jgi:hypothetical protein
MLSGLPIRKKRLLCQLRFKKKTYLLSKYQNTKDLSLSSRKKSVIRTFSLSILAKPSKLQKRTRRVILLLAKNRSKGVSNLLIYIQERTSIHKLLRSSRTTLVSTPYGNAQRCARIAMSKDLQSAVLMTKIRNYVSAMATE